MLDQQRIVLSRIDLFEENICFSLSTYLPKGNSEKYRMVKFL